MKSGSKESFFSVKISLFILFMRGTCPLPKPVTKPYSLFSLLLHVGINYMAKIDYVFTFFFKIDFDCSLI